MPNVLCRGEWATTQMVKQHLSERFGIRGANIDFLVEAATALDCVINAPWLIRCRDKKNLALGATPDLDKPLAHFFGLKLLFAPKRATGWHHALELIHKHQGRGFLRRLVE